MCSTAVPELRLTECEKLVDVDITEAQLFPLDDRLRAPDLQLYVKDRSEWKLKSARRRWAAFDGKHGGNLTNHVYTGVALCGVGMPLFGAGGARTMDRRESARYVTHLLDGRNVTVTSGLLLLG